jgi:hypothetical protein
VTLANIHRGRLIFMGASRVVQPRYDSLMTTSARWLELDVDAESNEVTDRLILEAIEPGQILSAVEILAAIHKRSQRGCLVGSLLRYLKRMHKRGVIVLCVPANMADWFSADQRAWSREMNVTEAQAHATAMLGGMKVIERGDHPADGFTIMPDGYSRGLDRRNGNRDRFAFSESTAQSERLAELWYRKALADAMAELDGVSLCTGEMK